MSDNHGHYTLDFTITDSAHYLHLYNLTQYAATPERPQYLVKRPGYANGSYVPANAYGMTDVSSQTLSAVGNAKPLSILPDGIYEITFEFCPYDQFCLVKNFYRSYNLQKTLAERLMDRVICADDIDNKMLFGDLMEIDILMSAITAAVENNKLILAAEFLARLNAKVSEQNQMC